MNECAEYIQRYLASIDRIPKQPAKRTIGKRGHTHYKVYLDGEFVSETYAKTQEHAINNVRHNTVGDVPDWDDYNWKAVPQET